MATFSTKSLHFPGGVPKKQKNKDVGLFRPRLCQDSKIFVFLVFWYLLTKWQRFPPNVCIFLEGYQKKRILDSSGLAFANTLKSLFLFGSFGTSSQNGNVFHQKLAFSWRGTKKTKKFLDSSGLAFAKILKSLFLVLLVPPHKMATFSTKSLHFPGGVPNKPKKPKILDTSGLAFAKTLKSLFFLVLLVPPHKMATFSTKSLHFPGGVPGTKTTKKDKDFGLFRPRLRQDSNFLVFWFFWYLLTKWQHFLSWLFCLLTTVSYSCTSNR